MRPLLLSLSIALVCAACGPQPSPGDPAASDSLPAGSEAACERPKPSQAAVGAYFPCKGGTPGQLYPVWRSVGGADSLSTVIRALLEGPSEDEQAMGFEAPYAPRLGDLTALASRQGADVVIALSGDLPDDPQIRSVGPGGFLGSVLWSVFEQFPEVEAVLFRLNGSEDEFRAWLGPGAVGTWTRQEWADI